MEYSGSVKERSFSRIIRIHEPVPKTEVLERPHMSINAHFRFDCLPCSKETQLGFPELP